MKKIIALHFILLFVYSVNSQTAFSLKNSGNPSNVAGGLSAISPWVGAQVGYLFGDSKEFGDNLLVSGKVLYEIDLNTDKFKLPVIGNISNIIKSKVGFETGEGKEKLDSEIKEIVNSTQGLHIGLYPYYKITEGDYFSLIAHGVVGWKLNGIQDTITNTITYLDQGRFSVGLEFVIGNSKEEKSPLTISVAPTLMFFSKNDYNKVFGVEKNSIRTLELTCVIPLNKGIGVMFENITPLSKGVDNLFRVGFIYTVETTTQE